MTDVVTPLTTPPVGGYVGWWDASQITSPPADGGLLSSWNDLSGNAHTLTSAGASRPTYYSTTTANLINGLPAVWFNHTHVISGSIPTRAMPYTIAVVCKGTSYPDTSYNVVASVINAWMDVSGSGSPRKWEIIATTTRTTNLNADTTAAHAVIAVFDPTNATVTVDGTTSSPVVAPGAQSTNGIAVGAGSTGALGGWTGPICEVIYYASALNSTDIASVNSYLYAKWLAPPGVTGTGSGAVSFAGSGSAFLGAVGIGTGAVAFAGSGTAHAAEVGFGVGAVAFAGSGTATVGLAGAGHITFAGFGAASTPTVGAGRIDFDGQGDADAAPKLDVYAPPEWSWYLLDSAGNHLDALLAATARKLTFQLDGSASATFSMPGEHPETASVAEMATDVMVARNGRNLFRGRVGGSNENHSATADQVDFTALDYRGLLEHRVIWPGMAWKFTGWDQSDIAWRLISDTQSLPGGSLGITRGAGKATGVHRDREYTAGNGVGQSITELGDIADGFDWEVNPSKVFNLYHPQRGRHTGLVLTYGRDIVAVTTTVDPSRYANAIYYTGSTPQTAPLGSTVSSIPSDVGRWEAQKSDPNLTLQAEVNEQAAGELALDSQLVSAYVVTLAADVWNPYLLWLGDYVRLIVQAGRLNVDITQRVVQIDVTLDDNGVETVVLTIGQVPQRLSDTMKSLSQRISKLELAPGIGNPGNFGGFDGSGGYPGGGGGIQQITSNDGSITVTDPFGPVTNLIVTATGGLIAVTNPFGPVTDLSIGGAGGGDTATISYPSTELIYYKVLPPGWSTTYLYSFAGATVGWLETVPDPGTGAHYPNNVSRIVEAGTYQMDVTVIVGTPLTYGSPAFTTLTIGASIGTVSVGLDIHTAGASTHFTTETVTYNSAEIAAFQPTAMIRLDTSALSTGVDVVSQTATVTIDATLTRVP